MNMLETIRKEISKSKKNRAQISRETGITEGQLHRIMKKNQSLYCETADKLLGYFGYQIVKKKGKAKK
ncbi:MAG: hypothetical protein JXM79_25450 [Sedimentisphaerales bacterium]|nr:hypothetical protein [Sedimentisphaerales bacterium]